jgi:hypothetical protein
MQRRSLSAVVGVTNADDDEVADRSDVAGGGDGLRMFLPRQRLLQREGDLDVVSAFLVIQVRTPDLAIGAVQEAGAIRV